MEEYRVLLADDEEEAFIKAMMQNYKELLTEYYYLMEQEVTDKG